jgi:hypothetical protein
MNRNGLSQGFYDGKMLCFFAVHLLALVHCDGPGSVAKWSDLIVWASLTLH